jgi:hypothetical protein
VLPSRSIRARVSSRRSGTTSGLFENASGWAREPAVHAVCELGSSEQAGGTHCKWRTLETTSTPGQEIPESADSHRWSVNVEEGRFPPLPDGCKGHAWVLKNSTAAAEARRQQGCAGRRNLSVPVAAAAGSK